ncbi:MAG: peptide chain release factor N(5)-glutamine methyltransferase [Aquificaceae bacterium]|nr:peptide chain release factor N(5)-glutamine methyltransferase [Aquificaceae bacterium]MDW8097756.1 peptide chain release factor N(5)-glutamine methyltransferase [Aquificaceae bacterium]
MKLRELLLKPSRVPLRDRALLLAHLLKLSHKELYLMEGLEVPPCTVQTFLEELTKLEQGYPLQYILGEWDFYGKTFRVREGVLIPRPETELLVEETLRRLPQGRELVGLELGVGTGCVSISLLLHREGLKMVAGDINPRALKLAKENAHLHGVSDRLLLFGGDLFRALKPQGFDFVVSNPPYVPADRWETLPEGVKLEGYNTLVGGVKGWEFYEKISQHISAYLKEAGFFAFEIGHDQGRVVRELFEKVGYCTEVLKDFAGQDRVVIGWRC